jgi:hypothetical protein
MQRRDFVKAIVAAASAATVPASAALAQQAEKLPPPVPKAPAPEPWMRGLLAAKPLPMTALAADTLAEPDRQFFTAQQTATLRRLCELFEPPYKVSPGAIAAGVPEFLDFLIGASPADRQQMYQSGLDQVDAQAQQHFQKAFAALDAAQADQILRPALRTWVPDHPPAEPFTRFLSLAQVDIREATTNSQAWADAAHSAGRPTPNVDLYWYPVEPDLNRPASPSHS